MADQEVGDGGPRLTGGILIGHALMIPIVALDASKILLPTPQRACITTTSGDTICWSTPLKLKEWLAESGTSYRELAGVAGINISTIHRFVAGKMWPQRDTLISLIKASGGRVTADDLLDVPKTLRAKR